METIERGLCSPGGVVALLAAVVLGACGGASQAAPSAMTGGQVSGGETTALMVSPDEEALLEGFPDDVTALQSRLGAAMALDAGPDCELAATLRDRICDLAERICDIGQRNPHDARVAAQCEDGRVRCDRARADVDESC